MHLIFSNQIASICNFEIFIVDIPSWVTWRISYASFAHLQFAILRNSPGQTPLKILNRALALASLPSLLGLSYSCLSLSSLVDLPWALRINGGS